MSKCVSFSLPAVYLECSTLADSQGMLNADSLSD